MPVERITLFCFAASYAVALGLELIQLAWPRPVQRLASNVMGGAGLLAQTLYLLIQPWSLASPYGSFLFLAWILAVFYLYGALHHRGVAWAVFVLPLVLGLIALAWSAGGQGVGDSTFRGDSVWGMVHGGLLAFAAVGVCVGFVASVMYL